MEAIEDIVVGFFSSAYNRICTYSFVDVGLSK